MTDAMKTLLRHRHRLNWEEADLFFEIAHKYASNTEELESMFADLANLTESLPSATRKSQKWIIELRERHPDSSVTKFVIDLDAAFYFMLKEEHAYSYIKNILEAAQGMRPLKSVPRSNSFSDSPDWYSEMYTNMAPDLVFEYEVEAVAVAEADEDPIPF